MRMHPVSRAMFGCGLILLMTANLGFAQDAKLPDGLRHVPADALGFIHFRAGDFLKSDAGKGLLQELKADREASKGLKKLEQMLGIAAGDLESVTVIVLTPPARSEMNRWDGPLRFNRTEKTAAQRKAEAEMMWKMKADAEFMKKRADDAAAAAKAKADRDAADKKKKDDEDKQKQDEDKKKAGEVSFPVSFQPGRFEHDHDGLDLMDVSDHFSISGALIVVTSTKALDRKKIMRTQLFNSMRHDPYGRGPGEPSILFLSDRTAMLGAAWELARYGEMMARNPGPKAQPMKSALAMGAAPHLVVAGGHLPVELRRMLFSPMMPDLRMLAPLAPLFQTEAALTLDLGKSIDLTLQFNAATEASAANALQAVKTLRVFGDLAIEKSRDQGESGGAKLELEKALTKALAETTIEQKGTTVHAQVKLELGPTFYKKFTKDIVAAFRTKGDRTTSVNNLKQIGIALHNYHDNHRSLPPAGIDSIRNADGKPLLSWRVAILPYIDQQTLYQQFNLNEPWDSPTNKKLIERMPPTYMVPGADAKDGETNYRVLVGPSTMFEPRKGPGGRALGWSLIQVTDGTSNTIMAVEASQPTIWTRPDDLPFDLNGPLPKLGVSKEGFLALFGDATVRFIPATTPDNVLRAYITRNGGEVVPFPGEK